MRLKRSSTIKKKMRKLKIVLKRRRVLLQIAIFGAIALFVGLFLFTRSPEADIQSRENKWFEITIPSLVKNREGSRFRHAKKLATLEDGCIDRKKYTNEFSRVFDFDSNVNSPETPQILIIGAHTAIGEALVRKYTAKGVLFTR